MKKLLLASVITCSMGLSGCIVHVGGHGDDSDIEFGYVRSNQSDLSSVNSYLRIETHRQVGDVSNVNGNIELQAFAAAKDIDAVNGNIELTDNNQADNVNSVNGDIRTNGSHIAHNIESVNGQIKVHNSQVSGDIISLNGDVSLDGSSHIKGDIVFKSKKRSWWSGNNNHQPTLKISADSQIDGRIILQQPVKLDVANPALLNKVDYAYKA